MKKQRVATVGKHFYMQIALVMVLSSTLVACTSFRPEKTDCSNKLTAPIEGMRSDVETREVEQSQPVAVRLNGVSASCHTAKGMVVMDVSAGLKVSRDLSEGIETARVQVPVLVSKIGQDEQPYGADSFGFSMAFAKNKDTLYPVVEFRITLEEGARAVLALTPDIVVTQ